MSSHAPVASPTRTFAEYIAGASFEAIPAHVREESKYYVLDSMANAVAGLQLGSGRILLELFSAMGGVPEARVWATGQRMPLLHAVYLNCALANILDFDDTFERIAHPGITAVQPALNVGEHLHARGTDVLTAIITAYEVSLRICVATRGTPARVRQVTGMGVWQIFGAVAAAASLMKLDTEQTIMALGLGGTNAPVPNLGKLGMELEERPFAWSKNNFGWAGMGGVLGCQLAAKGFVGNRFIFDGDRGFWVMSGSDQCDWEALTGGLGGEWMILKTGHKTYASGRSTHAVLDAVRAITQDHAVPVDQIETITVRRFSESPSFVLVPEPANITDAQFSVACLVAMELLGMSPADGVREEWLADPRVPALAKKVRLEVGDAPQPLDAQERSMGAQVRIKLAGIPELSATVTRPKGEPDNPVTHEWLERKFMTLVEPTIGRERGERLRDQILSLEKLTDVALLDPPT